MSKYTVLLVAALFSVIALAQDASYDSSNNLLLIPSINAEGAYFARVILALTDDNFLEVTQFSELSNEENLILARINQSNCLTAHPLTKLLAIPAFQTLESSLCLKQSLGSGAEGGTLFSYLLIDQEGPTLVIDNRQVGFSACCLEIYDGINNIQAGYYESEVFVEWDLSSPIELSRDYVLRLSFPLSETVEY
ncbi:MAG: hypothetical protein MI746_09995 [Pseudomonadales bacterium]|nr:hypothetical protein [Pseudomonadales bacterium]